MARTNTLLIRTPEGVVFSQFLAGPMTRFLAWLIDLFCIFTMTLLLMMVLSLLSWISVDFFQAVAVLIQFVLMIGYGIVLEWHGRGQTFGKRVMRLRVMDAEGLRLTFSQVVVRNLLRFADMLPVLYLTGGVSCLLSRRSQRLGDIAANTIVVRIPKLAEPNLEHILAGKFNSLRAHPHLEARLRQRVSAAEAAVALQALLRRDILEPKARVELFSEIAEHFRSKLAFPPEATEGITDEQYVRNLVDSLYRSGRAARVTKTEVAETPPGEEVLR